MPDPLSDPTNQTGPRWGPPLLFDSLSAAAGTVVRRRGGPAPLPATFAKQDHGDRLQHDLEVLPDALLANVLEIEFHFQLNVFEA
jgi:hypothetical protein